jgi:hypothetical protein
MAAQTTGTRTSLVAIAFFAGAVAIGALVARQHNIPVEASVTFLEALFREMAWAWSLGGFLLALLGCITAEKARNRGASGLLMGPLAALSFLLAIGGAGGGDDGGRRYANLPNVPLAEGAVAQDGGLLFARPLTSPPCLRPNPPP